MQSTQALPHSFGLKPLFMSAAVMLTACVTVRPPVHKTSDNLEESRNAADNSVAVAQKTGNNFEKSRNVANASVTAAQISAQAAVVEVACKAAGETNNRTLSQMCSWSMRHFYMANNENQDLTPLMNAIAKAGKQIDQPSKVLCNIKDSTISCRADETTEPLDPTKGSAAKKEVARVAPAYAKPTVKQVALAATPPLPVAANQNSTVPGNRMLDHVKRKAPELLVGMGIGMAVRTGGHALAAYFGLTAMTLTLPASGVVAVSVVSLMALGALGGGITEILLRHRRRQGRVTFKHEDTKWAAFRRGAIKGAIGGALGGVVGAGIIDYFKPDGLLHGLFHHAQHSLHADVTAPVHAVAQPNSVTPPVPSPDTAPAGHGAGIADGVTAVDLQSLLTPDQLHSLPQALQKLASSNNTKDVLVFCKEASARLAQQHTAASYRAAAKLIQHGLDVAAKADIHNHLVEKLQADMSYLKAWKLGSDNNICDAFQHAKHAGNAVHGFARRLAEALPKMAAKCMAPAAG